MCTVFHVYNAQDCNVIGKNYDIQSDSPITLFINKRGVSKIAIIKPPERPA